MTAVQQIVAPLDAKPDPRLEARGSDARHEGVARRSEGHRPVCRMVRRTILHPGVVAASDVVVAGGVDSECSSSNCRVSDTGRVAEERIFSEGYSSGQVSYRTN